MRCFFVSSFVSIPMYLNISLKDGRLYCSKLKNTKRGKKNLIYDIQLSLSVHAQQNWSNRDNWILAIVIREKCNQQIKMLSFYHNDTDGKLKRCFIQTIGGKAIRKAGVDLEVVGMWAHQAAFRPWNLLLLVFVPVTKWCYLESFRGSKGQLPQWFMLGNFRHFFPKMSTDRNVGSSAENWEACQPCACLCACVTSQSVQGLAQRSSESLSCPSKWARIWRHLSLQSNPLLFLVKAKLPPISRRESHSTGMSCSPGNILISASLSCLCIFS